jgi:hypothetical protein
MISTDSFIGMNRRNLLNRTLINGVHHLPSHS